MTMIKKNVKRSSSEATTTASSRAIITTAQSIRIQAMTTMMVIVRDTAKELTNPVDFLQRHLAPLQLPISRDREPW
ncbi:hypothetical protein SAHY_07747 [Salinisphaera hydrothermalis EPR70]